MDQSENCDLCGGELEIEFHYRRRELICVDCGAILDSDEFGEHINNAIDEDEAMEVME